MLAQKKVRPNKILHLTEYGKESYAKQLPNDHVTIHRFPLI